MRHPRAEALKRNDADKNGPEVLLLDLGRVLVDVDFDRCIRHWALAAGADPVRVGKRFRASGAFEAHERGELDCASYFARLSVELAANLTPDAVRAGWKAIFGPPVPGITERLERLAAHVDVHVLSNTNATHLDHLRTVDPGLFTPVRSVFASHELGMRKPEARIFRHVIDQLGCPAQHVHFLDDDPANVRAAARSGMRTTHVTDIGRTPRMLDAILTDLEGRPAGGAPSTAHR